MSEIQLLDGTWKDVKDLTLPEMEALVVHEQAGIHGPVSCRSVALALQEACERITTLSQDVTTWESHANANAVVAAERAKELAEAQVRIATLEQERDEARGDVVRMAGAKIGENCEHHRQPLHELERLALRECPLCWKACATELEARCLTLTQERDALAGCDGNCSCAVWRSRHEAATALYRNMDKLKAAEAVIDQVRVLSGHWRKQEEKDARPNRGWTDGKLSRCADDLDAILPPAPPDQG